MLLFAALNFVAVLFMRRTTWNTIRYLRRHGYNQSFAIVVGTGRVARKTATALRHASWMGIKNLGFVEDAGNGYSDLDWSRPYPCLLIKDDTKVSISSQQ